MIMDRDFYSKETFLQLKTEDLPSFPIEFADCTFTNCNFQGADLSGFIFDNCRFKGCNLSIVKLHKTKLLQVFLEDTKAEGLRFEHCDTFALSLNVSNSLLRSCTFSELNLKKASFSESNIIDCDFYKTNLSESSFEGSNLRGTMFNGCDLSKANFYEATDYTIDPSQNNVKHAKFSSESIAGLLRHLDIVIR